MSALNKIWNDFLISVITDTFGEFIDQSIISERVNWIVSKIYTIKPEKLYKNILYMMNNNPLSKMAIGYKIRFLEDDNWQNVFNDPYTEEFDKNDSLDNNDKKLISDLLNNFEIVVNHHIELILASNIKTNINDLSESIKQLAIYYNLPKLENMDNKMIRNGDLIYFMDFSQILYMVVFNQNPLNSEHCPDETQKTIRDKFPKRVQAMETLKIKWPNGIPLKYVKSSNIF